MPIDQRLCCRSLVGPIEANGSLIDDTNLAGKASTLGCFDWESVIRMCDESGTDSKGVQIRSFRQLACTQGTQP